MDKLSLNNQALKTTYTTLVILHQPETAWNDAANVPMRDLRFFAPSDSREM